MNKENYDSNNFEVKISKRTSKKQQSKSLIDILQKPKSDISWPTDEEITSDFVRLDN